MMIPAFLIKRFGEKGARLALIGAVLMLIGLSLLVTYCVGRGDGKADEVIERQAQEIELLEDVADANDSAAEARVADVQRIALNEKELNDALTTTSDPDTRRVLRGCIIMRQQGRNTAGLPACSRPAAGR